jgi:peroxiredoxin
VSWFRRLFQAGSVSRESLSPWKQAVDSLPTHALREWRPCGAKTLYDLSFESPVLLVFLRHAGCTFCREALGDLATVERRIRAEDSRLVIVHMGSEREGLELVQRFGLGEAHVIADPARRLYRAFELHRGTIGQLFGPRVLWRGFLVAILRRYGFGVPRKDVRQMPGVFLIREGKILREFRHQRASDRPDYVALTSCSLES